MTYWIYSIPIIIIYILNDLYITDEFVNINILIVILLLYPSMMLNIKRAHDRNSTGYFALLLFEPIVSLWPMIEFGFLKGDDDANSFGKPDKTWQKDK